MTTPPRDNGAFRFPVSVKGVVIRGGKVILLRNERDEWELPGGKLELGESPEACLAREIAEELATEIMHDPERMLREQVQEELEIGEPNMSPLREAWLTGGATAIGALIPVLPFFFLTGRDAIITSFVISMLSHFLVGGLRSIFTGRGLFRSGFDMFVVGLGVAAIGYYAGEWVGHLL